MNGHNAESIKKKVLANLTTEKLQQLLLDAQLKSNKIPKEMKQHKFWNTQPVVKNDESVEEDGEIQSTVLEDIRKEPYQLPSQFEWFLVDIYDEAEMKQLYELLCQNYVEDDDATFRFNYTSDFLKWALLPPGWKKEWHLGVRVKDTQKLVGFVSGIPVTLRIREHVKNIVEINFLCVHKKLRSKRLAPVLIKEITRRVNLFEIYQAVYTAGALLPKPFATGNYYHRNLNPKKLVEIEFTEIPRNSTLSSQIKLYSVSKTYSLPGFRKMEEKDLEVCHKLLFNYLQDKFEFTQLFNTLEDFRHWFLPINNVIYSYVVENPDTGVIEEFISFYNLPTSVLQNPKHNEMKSAYLFYYVPKENSSGVSSLKELVSNALISAKMEHFDVFTCLNIMKNKEFLEDSSLKFSPGSGNLHYYLYNYRFKSIEPEQCCLVML
ncbi:hypothetical protein HDU92_008089 [Lobulomyces angularis]|nr:hypothetical protein HDU92_008089 [Lobulomyces angularis]